MSGWRDEPGGELEGASAAFAPSRIHPGKPSNPPTQIDQLRVMWAAADVAQGRPALSRWHRDYKALFEEYMREGQALAQEGAPLL